MKKFYAISVNIILVIQVLLVLYFFFDERVKLPALLQAAGRLHPLVLHLPIGFLVFLVVLVFLKNQFKKKAFERVVLLCLLLTSFSASFSALMGLFLALQNDYGEEIITRHKISGLILSLLCYALLLLYSKIKDHKVVYNLTLTITSAALLYTGHTGSMITHGENFVLEPLMSKDIETLSAETSSLYKLSVEPLLNKKCFSCHNESKAKGKLIMTSVEKFAQGGENGPVWVAGNPDSSRLIQFIHLPLEHDNHMPPDGKPQLTEFEISLLAAWVKAGADFDKKLNEYDPADTLVILSEPILKGKGQTDAKANFTFKPAAPELIEKLNTPFRTVFPLHVNSPALQVDFFVKEFFQLSALEELKEINDQIVVLNLSKMPVTDSDLKLLSSFKNLEILNLNFTNINGSGLEYLKSCTQLKSVSLSGTKVSKNSLTSMLTIPFLQKLYIWNTSIDETERVDLEKEFPKVTFVHSLFKDESMLALSKPIMINEGVLKNGEALQLKHSMPEVIIRYTIDGTKPDSVSGILYKEPIALIETVKLQAIACKQGWFCSKLFESVVFVEGKKALQAELLSPPDKQYLGEGAASLLDGRKGFADNFREPSWLGYRDNVFAAGFDFGSNPLFLKKLVLSYGDNLGSYIFPPTEVEVWGGKSNGDLRLLKTEKVEQPSGYRPQHTGAIAITINESKYNYYKVVAKPVSKLPPWHGGKGQKGWFFVDEVFFY
jgi:uncharacterized membrane protein